MAEDEVTLKFLFLFLVSILILFLEISYQHEDFKFFIGYSSFVSTEPVGWA